MHIDVDEAGKGPVLGPMAATAIRGNLDALPDGITDSKRLAPERREEFAAELRERNGASVGVALVEPETTDGPRTDVNLLTVRTQAEAAVEVAVGADEFACDTGSVNGSRFGHRIREGLAEAGVLVAVCAQHRADGEHAIVGATSIMAKIKRSRRIEAIADGYGEAESGYLSDGTIRELPREYVHGHGILPDCARKLWLTCADLMTVHEQPSSGDF